jgi:hypothetical protein
MSPCDHMILFVAKSSPEWTRVPRRVTSRLTVRLLVNINPGQPRTSSTAALRKPQHRYLGHQEVNPRASSSLSACMASSIEPSRKQGREEVPPPPARRAREGVAALVCQAREGEVAPARGDAAAPAHRGEASPARGGEAALAQGGEVTPAQGGTTARGGRACSCTKC